ncbi:hypothetical protein N9I13_00520 [bacterium]|nr:hypothetical protein [bacterium]
MPTLEQLFKNRQLPSQGGKTAEEAYDIRNSKDIRISAADPFVNTVGMSLARLARKTIGAKGSETLLEEELTGARIIRTASMPFIYGTELPRLTLRSTPLLDKMREATGGDVGGGGLLGGLISKGRDFVNDKLGIPSGVIPTKVVGFSSISKKGETQNRMIDLAEIKKSGEGSLLGKFLKGTGGGNIKDIGKQALGSALKLGKDKLRGALFGTPGTTGFNGASLIGLKNTTTNYGSIDSATGVTIAPADADGIIDAKGLMYSKTFNLNIPLNKDGKDIRVGLDKNKQNDPNPNKLDFGDISDEGGLGGRYSKALTDLDIPNKILFSSNPDREGKFFASKKGIEISKDDFIEKRRGMYQRSDVVNSQGVYEGETKTLGEDTNLDDIDFVTLKFTSLGTVNGKLRSANFRATISGLSETFSPSWDSAKFIGNPFSYYTYSGIERSVTFNFKVYSMNAYEHKIGWDKLNFLSGLVYPADYYGNSAVKAPIIKFTLGDMYKKKASFIESLSYSIDDNTPWNITNKEKILLSNAGGIVTGVPETLDIDMKGYRLPTIVDVSITIKFIESRKTTGTELFRSLYTFTPQS